MNIIDNFKELLIAILDRNPFYYYILKNLRIIYVETTDRIACVDKKFRLYLTKKFFNLNKISQIKILEHEILHLVFKHPNRIENLKNMYNVDEKIINLIADAIVNYRISLDIVRDIDGKSYRAINFGILMKIFRNLRRYGNNIYKMSLEEIVQKLYKEDFEIYSTGEEIEQIQERTLSLRGRFKEYLDINEVVEEKLMEKTVIQNGTLYEDNEENIEEKFDNIVRENLYLLEDKVLAFQINEMYRTKINWKSYFKYFVYSNLRAYQRLSTWTKINRILPGIIPGKRCVERKNILIGIDTSASVSDYDLKLFIQQLYDIIRYTNIILYYWDTEAYGPMFLKTYKDVKIKTKRIQGRGGTKVESFLREAKKHDYECLIIMSDCLWEEEDDYVEKNLPNKPTLILTLKRVPKIERKDVKIIRI